jgi:outer membrane protein OmpA-like peptidoglycan-associated protein
MLRVSIMKTLNILMLGLVLVGCSASVGTTTTTSAELPAPGGDGNYHVQWPSEGSGVARTITLTLGPDLHQWCRDVSPKFPFDKSDTYVDDKAELVALASCLNKPGLENRQVILVGRADPRGSDAYNMALGERRAQSIKDFLVANGLSASRIAITSEGKRDAKGHQPVVVEGQVDPTMPRFTYGYDRRVDVVVTGGAHHP